MDIKNYMINIESQRMAKVHMKQLLLILNH